MSKDSNNSAHQYNMSANTITTSSSEIINPGTHGDSEKIQNKEVPTPQTLSLSRFQDIPVILDPKAKKEQTNSTIVPIFDPQGRRNAQSPAAWAPTITFPTAPTIASIDRQRTPAQILALLETLSPSDFPPPRPRSAPPNLQYALAPCYNPVDMERWLTEKAIRESLDQIFEQHRAEDPVAPYYFEQEAIMLKAAEDESKANTEQDPLYSSDQDFLECCSEGSDFGDEEVDSDEA